MMVMWLHQAKYSNGRIHHLYARIYDFSNKLESMEIACDSDAYLHGFQPFINFIDSYYSER